MTKAVLVGAVITGGIKYATVTRYLSCESGGCAILKSGTIIAPGNSYGRIKMKRLMSVLLSVIFALALTNWAFAGDKKEARPDYKKYYEGTIGDNLKISMKLDVFKSEIKGSYRYKKYRQDMELKGKLMADGVSLELTESADNKVTGRFKGNFSKDYNSLQGNWFGKKTLPFSLDAIANIVAEEQKEYNIEYERVEFILPDKPLSRRLNSKVKESIDSFYKEYIKFYNETKQDPDGAKNLKTEWGFSLYLVDINYFPGKIVGITYDNLIEFAGPHPNVAIINVNIGIGKKDIYGITPDMMFKKKSAYLKRISDIWLKSLTKSSGSDGESPYSDAEVEDLLNALKRPETYSIKQGGLEVAYQRTHAGGTQFVLIPYDKLKTIIEPDGPLGYFITDKR
ncbi:MAG: hypothetical protein HQK89_12475 [Nitrospirae bacterium]|nr:hypothetical protein [Nitrospirota bacterium]